MTSDGAGLLSICKRICSVAPSRAGCHTDGLPFFFCRADIKRMDELHSQSISNANKIISITKSNLPSKDAEAEQFGIVLISFAKLAFFHRNHKDLAKFLKKIIILYRKKS